MRRASGSSNHWRNFDHDLVAGSKRPVPQCRTNRLHLTRTKLRRLALTVPMIRIWRNFPCKGREHLKKSCECQNRAPSRRNSCARCWRCAVENQQNLMSSRSRQKNHRRRQKCQLTQIQFWKEIEISDGKVECYSHGRCEISLEMDSRNHLESFLDL